MQIKARRQTWVEIDLDALEHNIGQIKNIIGDDCDLIAVVKADAYGHGSVDCALTFRNCGVNHFAVATLDEAIELREAGIDGTIVTLGVIPDNCINLIIGYDLTPVIFKRSTASLLSTAAVNAGRTASCLLAIDTGMGRIGYTITDEVSIKYLVDEAAAITGLPGIELIGLMSHLSSADEADSEYTKSQIDAFSRAGKALKDSGIDLRWNTLANSAGIMGYPDAGYDAVRAGLILYGCYPSEHVDRSKLDLRPAMSVKANIVHLKSVPTGTSISYGRLFTTDRESKIATISIGYADGYSRSLTGKAYVLVNGVKAPVVGAICMDQCMIDVTDVPDAEHCDEVIVMGRDGDAGISAEDIAEMLGTINYEVLCDFGMRLQRIYVRSGE